jgi:hypothetical protein
MSEVDNNAEVSRGYITPVKIWITLLLAALLTMGVSIANAHSGINESPSVAVTFLVSIFLAIA